MINTMNNLNLNYVKVAYQFWIPVYTLLDPIHWLHHHGGRDTFTWWTFACYKPPSHLKVTSSKFLIHSTIIGCFNKTSLDFQSKILERSGLGEETYLPQSLHCIPSKSSIDAARDEVEQVVFGALDNLFANTKVNPKDINIVIVNCSLFNPAPSITAMIVNRNQIKKYQEGIMSGTGVSAKFIKYKMGNDVRSFNLGGMGCSASILAIDLAKDLLQLHKNSYVVVVSTETITRNWYFGNNKAMLIQNCLFRLGGAAILLSNKVSKSYGVNYELVHVVRTHNGADDKSFKCVQQVQDSDGKFGVCLSRDLMIVAGKALKANISTLGPLFLRANFKHGFYHFCIHAGSKAVINEVEKSLQLLKSDSEASKMTLHRFGNTSSSSIWYELAYIEAKHKMNKGNRVWQIAFGVDSSVIVLCGKPSPNNPWEDCIDNYPVEN
ncbi:unnamed protein product [Sphenostylis stenocarpa]|uniref:3-ketoacyl-CoA synthase n=1 Tax=Sphenostylis stenocarpa TaxID=92480 RepID=A0AA86RXZ0_9FABA|nr:unnamed protein product [Sphenostylis stenocarpa]